jgi:hypothetical protein
VRFLYIALAAALLWSPCRPSVSAADDLCASLPAAAPCPDDGDPCTVDACADGVCGHIDVADRTNCEPLVPVYNQAVGLGALVAELDAAVATATLPETARILMTNALQATAASLTRTSDALSGRIAIPEPAAGETITQARSRAAFGIARATPTRVRSVMRLLAVPSVRAASGSSIDDLARRARFLYRNTNLLKRDLRSLQRVSGVFAR